MKSVGIDIGTTSISAVVMDLIKREVVTSRTIPNGGFLGGKPWERIQDPEMLVKKAKDAVDELLSLYPDVCSIGLTGQMHGIVYLNAEGKAISPLYTWQDGSADQALADGKSVVSSVKEKYHLAAATGFGTLTYLYHVKTGQVPENAVKICTVPDYLGMVLTGRASPLVHASMAASMGLYNAETFSFLTDVLQTEGGDPAMLPQTCLSMEELGTYQEIPVYTSFGDNQAAFLGSIGFQKDVWSLNVGTSSQTCVLSEKYFEAPGIDVRPYLDGMYLLTGAGLCGGRAYAVLERFFREYVSAFTGKEESQYALMERLAGEAVQSGGEPLRTETLFAGTRNEPDRRGSITGLSEDNFHPGQLIYSVMEGMVREIHEMYRAMGTGADRVVCSGNGFRKNRILMEIAEKITGLPVSLADCEEEAACGAARAAAEMLKRQ